LAVCLGKSCPPISAETWSRLRLRTTPPGSCITGPFDCCAGLAVGIWLIAMQSLRLWVAVHQMVHRGHRFCGRACINPIIPRVIAIAGNRYIIRHTATSAGYSDPDSPGLGIYSAVRDGERQHTERQCGCGRFHRLNVVSSLETQQALFAIVPTAFGIATADRVSRSVEHSSLPRSKLWLASRRKSSMKDYLISLEKRYWPNRPF
jgi:hypothetical protein